MKVGIIGRTNVGKSTFFKALTLEEVQIEDRPFTTIDPNRGIGYVTVHCPEKEFNTKCNPHNSPCVGGVRRVPLEVIDVAGLIEGASAGKGLGNKFLSEAMEADALIEVIDVSGKSNESGGPAIDYDPAKDIDMVERELVLWIKSIILKSRVRNNEDISEAVYKSLSGLKFRPETVRDAIKKNAVKTLDDFSAESISRFVLDHDKPIVIACNKMDATDNLKERMNKLKSRYKYDLIPCSAAAELTLKEAEKHGFLEYPENNFKITKDLNKDQTRALDIVGEIIKKNGSTGVQEILNHLVLETSKNKVIFTVEDEKKLCDGRGRILPDAYIVKESATPRDVAGIVHTDLVQKYKGAIDCRTNLKIKNDEPVKNGQILKIII